MDPLFPGSPLIKSDVYLDAFGFFKGQGWKWGGVAYCLALSFLLGYVFSSLVVAFRGNPATPGSQRLAEDDFLAAAQASEAAIAKSSSKHAALDAIALKDGGGEEARVVVGSEEAATAAPPTGGTVNHRFSPTSSSVLPFTPATLSFSDISYSVTLKDKSTKQILSGIHGVAHPGGLMALMGASGAGKTTLLDVLAARKTVGKVEGRVLMNSTEVSSASLSKTCGFAEQQNLHADYMTVQEAVEFSARLRLPASVPTPTRLAFVREVLSLLELTPLKNYRTGSLALGEAKRLTIAVELAANPPIIFLDEPTTGLDSRAAAQVMKVLRGIANTGRTIIATIHQPSSAVFFSFDSLLLLAPGGLQTYCGQVGKSGSAIVSYLQSLPSVKPLPSGVNPASWMLGELSSGSGAAAAAAVSAYPSSPMATAVKSEIAGIVASQSASPPFLPRPGFITQLATLCKRMGLFSWRNTPWNSVRLFVFLTLSVFFGLLYRGVDDGNSTSFFSKLAVALNGLLFLSIINLQSGLPNYSKLRSVFYRERAGGAYSPVLFPLSLVLSEIPWTAFYALLFTSINYFLVGFKAEAGAFFTATLATFLSGLWFLVIGMGFIFFFPVPLLAAIAGGPTIQISILFAGVNLSREQLPAGWRWLYDADGFAHALRLFFLPQYDGDRTPLFDLNTQAFYPGGKLAYMESRLGTTPGERWNELGYLLAIIGSATFLTILFGATSEYKRARLFPLTKPGTPYLTHALCNRPSSPTQQ